MNWSYKNRFKIIHHKALLIRNQVNLRGLYAETLGMIFSLADDIRFLASKDEIFLDNNQERVLEGIDFEAILDIQHEELGHEVV